MARMKLVAGNWKMNGTAADLVEAQAIAAGAGEGVDVALCLPATLIERAARLVPGMAIGGQDVHGAVSGAHTGDVSAANTTSKSPADVNGAHSDCGAGRDHRFVLPGDRRVGVVHQQGRCHHVRSQ